MKISDEQIQRLLPRKRRYKVGCGKGLTIHVQPTGSKTWFYRYRVDKKEYQVGFGPYPEISLEMAWQKTMQAREQLREGIIPMEYKRDLKKTMAITLKKIDKLSEAIKEWESQ